MSTYEIVLNTRLRVEAESREDANTVAKHISSVLDTFATKAFDAVPITSVLEVELEGE